MSASGTEDVDISFETFYVSTAPRMLARARILCGPRLQDAENVVADAYVEAFRRWDRLSVGRKLWELERWVHTTMKRKWWRTARDRQQPTAQEEIEAQQQPSPSAEGTFEHQDSYQRVLDAFDALPRRQRDVAVSHWLENTPIPEIAKKLDISPKTVREHLRQARKKLTNLLGLEQPPGAEEQFVAVSTLRSARTSARIWDPLCIALLETEAWLCDEFQNDKQLLERVRNAIADRTAEHDGDGEGR